MWQAYKKENQSQRLAMRLMHRHPGALADELADLVLRGEDSDSFDYELYKLENEPTCRRQEALVMSFLDSQDRAVCIVEITKVSVLPLIKV